MSHYIEIADIDNFSTGLTTTQKQAIIDRVEEKVERIAKDYFYPKTFHLFLDGNGKGQIFPKFKSKILSVNKLVIDEVAVNTVDITSTGISGSSGEYKITLTKSGVTEDYYENDYLGIYDASESLETSSTASGDCYWGSRIITNTATSSGVSIFTLENSLPVTLTTGDVVSIIYNWEWNDNSIYRNKPISALEPGVLNEPSSFFWEEKFPRGSRNIEIWGSMGWYSCPLEIKEACIILCRAENDSTLYSSYSYGMKSEKLGDYSYTRFGDFQGKTLTGVLEADVLLSKYIRQKPILGAV